MNRPLREPLHLQALRAVTGVGLALLIAWPLCSTLGTVAAGTAAFLAIAIAPALSRSRLRLPVIALACVGLVASGLGAERTLGRFETPALWLGLPAILGVLESVRVGLIVFGGFLLIRTAALRFPAIAVLETFAAVLAAVRLFLTHRDMQLGRPFFLADRAFERNLEPDTLLTAIGIAVIGSAFLLFLPRRRARHTLAGLLCVACLLVGGFYALRFYKPENLLKDPPPDGGEAQHAMKEKDAPGSKSPGGGGKGSQKELDFTPPPPTPQQNRPVAVVNLEDDVLPIGTAWYLRQVVYSRYNGLKLVRATSEAADPDVPAQFPTERITIQGSPDDPRVVTRLRATIHLIEEMSRPFAPVSPVMLEPRPNPDPEHFRRTYGVESLVPTHPRLSGDKPLHLYVHLRDRRVGDPAWDARQREAYLTYPSDPRYLTLVKQIFAEAMETGRLPADHASKPVLEALAIKAWLEKNTIYSQKPQGLSETDPVGDFLFNRRKGYCVHIAHATAFLLRAAGIPSRVGAGYAVGLADAGSRSSLIVRGSDGHAWPEIFVTGFGWLVIDPAPTPEPDTPKPAPVDSRTAQKLDEMSRKDPVEKPADPPVKETDVPPSPYRWLVAMGLLAVFAASYAVKAWRRIAPCFAKLGSRQRLEFRAILDRLAEVGIIRQFGETREAFAKRIANAIPSFANLTDAHLRNAILDEHADDAQWSDLRRSSNAELTRGHSRLRRLVGLLNPVSWLATR